MNDRSNLMQKMNDSAEIRLSVGRGAMTAQPVHDDGFGLLPTARSDIAEMSRKARQSVLAPAQPGA